MFKLGKVKSNSIQIYQLKNASLMEFKQMEEAIVNNNNSSKTNMFNARLSKEAKEKNRIPHFGPLKGASKWKTQQTSTNPSISHKSHSQPQYVYTYASTHPTNQNTNLFSINK